MKIDKYKCAAVGIWMMSALACSTQQIPLPVNDESIYDGYRWGIHCFELTIRNTGRNLVFGARQKNLSTKKWGEAAESGLLSLDDDERFKFVGSVADFASEYANLSELEWPTADVVGWLKLQSSYVRHKVIQQPVDGHLFTATYWGEKDASEPMDLIVGSDGALIAAIDVTNDYVIVRRGFERFTTVAEWRSSNISQPSYGYRALNIAYVQTRQGSKLATQIVLPEGDGPSAFPTILVRTPYGITGLIDIYQQYATRGYAVVIQAVRGTAYWDDAAQSEGHWDAMVQEPADGEDTLKWIVGQPWSDGTVCMQGKSYYGYTQWALSMARNPALRCIIPEVSMGTAFSDQPFMGGTLVQGFAYYVFNMLNRNILPNRTWSDILRHRPIADIDLYATGEEITTWNNIVRHWTNDDYWKVQDWYQDQEPREFGSLNISGWFDDDFPGTRSNWAMMSKYGTRPNRLILGPWKHGYNVDRSLNGYNFGINAVRSDIWLIKQQWYDYYLKGIDNGVSKPTVQYFLLGDNEWRESDAWPPSDVTTQYWYFFSSGIANKSSVDGTLSLRTPPYQSWPDAYQYDPDNAARNWFSIDWMERWADMQSFPYDFRDIETRHDVVVYTSNKLDSDLTIAGNIKVVLYASTDVLDTDWWAYISDVGPDHSSNRLSVGVLRSRFRTLEDPDYHVFGSNFENEILLSGDDTNIVKYEISIPSVANTFKKGHRIRIAIMNALDNYAFPNSNTGEHEAYVTRSIIGTMKIHHSPAYPSHVQLPVLERVN